MSEITNVTRDYSDNFAVKDFAINNLIPAYFPDIDVSLRSVGTLGYVTELITNYGEDVFNTGSVLFRESFPNRAQIPESIYSHAAIFQLSNIFSTAARCRILLVMEEEAIIKNMVDDYDKDTGIYHFYIGKNTIIYVEDIPFCIDYDVQMNIVKKSTENGDDYLFTAAYIMNGNDYNNSISDITDPYVKIRRSADGYIAIEVVGHQCLRDVHYEQIITNSYINYPVIDIPFDGKLAGFDILYKPPTTSIYSQLSDKVIVTEDQYIQMETLISYSQAIKNPFCYYELIDTNTLRITFNTKDNFFMPEFNSELKIILYITQGEAGNFDVYNGHNISVVPDTEKRVYANTYLTAAQPIGSCHGGSNQMEIDALQALAVEGFRTANALTTENDLSEYFGNYGYRYGNSLIKFIKKRDDVYERVYSGFMIIRNNDFIYKANTLNLKLNLSEMINPDKNVYLLEAGYLFTANDTTGYATFLRDEAKYKKYYDEYQEAIKKGEINYITDKEQHLLPAYLQRPASFAEFKLRKGYDDKRTVFDLTKDELQELDDPSKNKFLLINPFLIRVTRNPNLVSTYMTYVDNVSLVDFTNQNAESYVQFVLYTLYLSRKFEVEKRYNLHTNVASSITLDSNYPMIAQRKKTIINEFGMEEIISEYILNDKYVLDDNDTRILVVIDSSKGEHVCFTELYPTAYDKSTNNFTFNGSFLTNDHITSDGRLRLLDNTIYRNEEDKSYYKVHEGDSTEYTHYDSNDNVLEESVSVNTITELYNSGKLRIWKDLWNMTTADDINIPMTDVTCKIFTLYRRIYNDNDGALIMLPEDYENDFSKFDPSLKGYIVTNEYSTSTEPITFIKPLNSVRTYMKFEDYTEATQDSSGTVHFTHDIMDVDLTSISFLRAATALDEESVDYFMTNFLANYNFLTDIIQTTLRNATNIDVKFTNTYGRSRNFFIGENEEMLDTNNLSLIFDAWFVQGTDLLTAVPEVKSFIKSTIETINSDCMNNLYISNLMRKIESNFAYVDHIRFVGINSYNSTYQAVKNNVTDLNDLSVEERRFYVPEILTCDVENITINEYYSS